MNRVLGHCLAGLSVLTGAISLTSACAHDDSSFFVQAVIFPNPQGSGTQCTYTANPSQIFQSRGVVDTALRAEYDPVFLLANQLVAQSNPNQAMTETSNINVQGAIVRVTDAAGNQLSTFTSPTSGTLYAAVGGTPGYAVISATAIDSTALTKAGFSPGTAPASNSGNKTLLSYLKFYGHTLGGDYIESNEFEYPVDVCYGCLIGFSASDINTCYENIPNCEGAATAAATSGSAGGSSSQNTPCQPGQDTVLDCSQCLDLAACRPNPGKYVCNTGDGGAG